MTIPASGPLSMSMFNTELGYAANTANTRLVSGSKPTGVAENVPGTGSQFWLANASSSLNQAAPHSFNEWYGYKSTFTVRFFANTAASIGATQVKVSYSTNGGTSWTSKNVSAPVSPSFTNMYSVEVNKGTNFRVAIQTTTAADVTFGANLTGTSVPSTGYCGQTTAYIVSSVTGNTDIYASAQVVGGALQAC